MKSIFERRSFEGLFLNSFIMFGFTIFVIAKLFQIERSSKDLLLIFNVKIKDFPDIQLHITTYQQKVEKILGLSKIWMK